MRKLTWKPTSHLMHAPRDVNELDAVASKLTFPTFFASFQQTTDMEATEGSQVPNRCNKLGHAWWQTVDWRCRHQRNVWALSSGMPHVTSCPIIHFHQELQRQQQEKVLFVQYSRFLSANGVHSPPQRSYLAISLSFCSSQQAFMRQRLRELASQASLLEKDYWLFPVHSNG